MFIFILPSISDGIKTEDLFWRKPVANSNQTWTCVTLARFPRQNHSAKKWKNIEFAGEKPFNWIKSERDENLRWANSRESNQNRSIFLFELSVIMRYTNIKNRLEHLSKHLYRVIYSKIIIEHFIRFTIIFKSSYRIYSM